LQFLEVEASKEHNKLNFVAEFRRGSRLSNIFLFWQYCVGYSRIIGVSQNALRARIFLKMHDFKSDVKNWPKVDP